MFANTRFLDMLVIIQTIQHTKKTILFWKNISKNLIIAVTHAPFVLISIKTIKY